MFSSRFLFFVDPKYITNSSQVKSSQVPFSLIFLFALPLYFIYIHTYIHICIYFTFVCLVLCCLFPPVAACMPACARVFSWNLRLFLPLPPPSPSRQCGLREPPRGSQTKAAAPFLLLLLLLRFFIILAVSLLLLTTATATKIATIRGSFWTNSGLP